MFPAHILGSLGWRTAVPHVQSNPVANTFYHRVAWVRHLPAQWTCTVWDSLAVVLKGLIFKWHIKYNHISSSSSFVKHPVSWQGGGVPGQQVGTWAESRRVGRDCLPVALYPSLPSACRSQDAPVRAASSLLSLPGTEVPCGQPSGSLRRSGSHLSPEQKSCTSTGLSRCQNCLGLVSSRGCATQQHCTPTMT